MTLTTRLLTNRAYGFPRGALRSHTPHVLACVHITGNPKNVGPTAALNERTYANRAGSPGPSAHVYLDRDGSGIVAVDHVKYAAWSNGDVIAPDTHNPGVATILKHRAAGHNANECVWLEIECVGAATKALQITDGQMTTLAHLIAAESRRTGIAPSRSTVLTHADIDSVNRQNCAFLAATREARMSDLLRRIAFVLTPRPQETVTLTVTGDKPLTVSTTPTLVSVRGTNLTARRS